MSTVEQLLEKIVNWELPKTGKTWPNGADMSYSFCFGSNGERNYMRSVAREALAQLRADKVPCFACNVVGGKHSADCPVAILEGFTANDS